MATDPYVVKIPIEVVGSPQKTITGSGSSPLGRGLVNEIKRMNVINNNVTKVYQRAQKEQKVKDNFLQSVLKDNKSPVKNLTKKGLKGGVIGAISAVLLWGIDKMIRAIKTTFAPIFKTFVGVPISALAKAFGPFLSLWEIVMTAFFLPVLLALLPVMEHITPILESISSFISADGLDWDKFFDEIEPHLGKILDGLLPIAVMGFMMFARLLWATIVGWLKLKFKQLTGVDFDAVIEWVRNNMVIVGGILSLIGPPFLKIIGLFMLISGLLTTVIDSLKFAFNPIVRFFKSIGGWLEFTWHDITYKLQSFFHNIIASVLAFIKRIDPVGVTDWIKIPKAPKHHFYDERTGRPQSLINHNITEFNTKYENVYKVEKRGDNEFQLVNVMDTEKSTI